MQAYLYELCISGMALLQLDPERNFLVEVDDTRNQQVDLPIGCVQASILGHRLFTIYCRGPMDPIGAKHFVSYADDSYVVIEADNLRQNYK